MDVLRKGRTTMAHRAERQHPCLAMLFSTFLDATTTFISGEFSLCSSSYLAPASPIVLVLQHVACHNSGCKHSITHAAAMLKACLRPDSGTFYRDLALTRHAGTSWLCCRRPSPKRLCESVVCKTKRHHQASPVSDDPPRLESFINLAPSVPFCHITPLL